MVMRIFDPDTAVKDLDALGFSPHDAQRWEGWPSGPTASSSSPARPAPARPPPSIRR
jgi:hypothetical protein